MGARCAIVTIWRIFLRCFCKSYQNSNSNGNSIPPTYPRTIIETTDEGFISEQIIKKSRFIGIARQCKSWEEAQAAILRIREEHTKSRHVCFGVVLAGGGGNGEDPQQQQQYQERCSDDGEPSGTAGIPILGAIKGEGLANTLCVVVRYFGGVKLGAGGLIRAYASTARDVLRQATTMEMAPISSLRIQSTTTNSNSNIGQIYDIVRRFHGVVSEETYLNNGDFQLTISCETSSLPLLQQSLLDNTRGNITFL